MNFTLNILGTASALPIIDRFPSAHALDVRGRLFLIDCGEGVQMQIRRRGLSYLKIEAIFISHTHGDHLFGIFGLLSTMGMLGRTGDLHIFAPSSFAPVLSFFKEQFGEGLNYHIEFHVLTAREPVLIYSLDYLEILAFPLNHKIETYGFLFRETVPPLNVRKDAITRYGLTLREICSLKNGYDLFRPAGPEEEPSPSNDYTRTSGTDSDLVIPNCELTYIPYTPRSYAYCSDTAPFPELSEWVKGVDVLYHESTYPSEMTDKAVERFHSTSLQAAECATRAGAGKLIIGHYSSKYPDLSIFLDEARRIFPDTVLARDGAVIDIPLKKNLI